ncbi:dipeptidase 1-like [Lingula anatina]|uniref:Dipeptidase n=1 Tax=Lingula anatina TaxID=7574 RepID=A0A1S3HYQ2_LINAN|nr:dipeptidase 1-like [Lingula anatina]|eukprot:XP_013391152.1 dipeptidase 1-like [Lingula anatina]
MPTRNTREALMQTVNDILDRVPLVDGHNDFPWHIRLDTAINGSLARLNMSQDLRKVLKYRAKFHPSQTDIPRIKKGRLGAQFWVSFASCESQFKDATVKALEQLDLIKRMIAQYSDVFEFVTTADGIESAHKSVKVASLLAVEGGHHIRSSLGVLRMFYELGVRYMTLTWNCNTPWADCNVATRQRKPVHHGLTDFGKIVVKEMNRLGMMVDLSHVAVDTMHAALNVSEAPVIFSHSSAFALCPHVRNVPDDVLVRVKENGGIVMVNFYNDFINCSSENTYTGEQDWRPADINQVIEHIEYIRNITGVDHVGLGSDFDGIDRYPVGLEDVSKFPNILYELMSRGWSEEELEKLAGKNFLRVFRKVEEVKMSKVDQPAFENLIDINEIPDHSCISTNWEIFG